MSGLTILGFTEPMRMQCHHIRDYNYPATLIIRSFGEETYQSGGLNKVSK